MIVHRALSSINGMTELVITKSSLITTITLPLFALHLLTHHSTLLTTCEYTHLQAAVTTWHRWTIRSAHRSVARAADQTLRDIHTEQQRVGVASFLRAWRRLCAQRERNALHRWRQAVVWVKADHSALFHATRTIVRLGARTLHLRLTWALEQWVDEWRSGGRAVKHSTRLGAWRVVRILEHSARSGMARAVSKWRLHLNDHGRHVAKVTHALAVLNTFAKRRLRVGMRAALRRWRQICHDDKQLSRAIRTLLQRIRTELSTAMRVWARAVQGARQAERTITRMLKRVSRAALWHGFFTWHNRTITAARTQERKLKGAANVGRFLGRRIQSRLLRALQQWGRATHISRSTHFWLRQFIVGRARGAAQKCVALAWRRWVKSMRSDILRPTVIRQHLVTMVRCLKRHVANVQGLAMARWYRACRAASDVSRDDADRLHTLRSTLRRFVVRWRSREPLQWCWKQWVDHSHLHLLYHARHLWTGHHLNVVVRRFLWRSRSRALATWRANTAARRHTGRTIVRGSTILDALRHRLQSRHARRSFLHWKGLRDDWQHRVKKLALLAVRAYRRITAQAIRRWGSTVLSHAAWEKHRNAECRHRLALVARVVRRFALHGALQQWRGIHRELDAHDATQDRRDAVLRRWIQHIRRQEKSKVTSCFTQWHRIATKQAHLHSTDGHAAATRGMVLRRLVRLWRHRLLHAACARWRKWATNVVNAALRVLQVWDADRADARTRAVRRAFHSWCLNGTLLALEWTHGKANEIQGRHDNLLVRRMFRRALRSIRERQEQAFACLASHHREASTRAWLVRAAGNILFTKVRGTSLKRALSVWAEHVAWRGKVARVLPHLFRRSRHRRFVRTLRRWRLYAAWQDVRISQTGFIDATVAEQASRSARAGERLWATLRTRFSRAVSRRWNKWRRVCLDAQCTEDTLSWERTVGTQAIVRMSRRLEAAFARTSLTRCLETVRYTP